MPGHVTLHLRCLATLGFCLLSEGCNKELQSFLAQLEINLQYNRDVIISQLDKVIYTRTFLRVSKGYIQVLYITNPLP